MPLRRTRTYQSFSSEGTKTLGEELAKKILKKAGRRKSAAIFALKGDLGAGKTTFVQGFFKGLGMKKRASSPTFVIMRRYALPRVCAHKGLANVFHADAYRLKGAKHFAAIGFKEILADPRNVALIEWAERIKNILPKDAVWLAFRHGKHENERHIMINGNA